MPLLQKNLYTIEDIYNLPEGTRAELTDGQIYYMAPTSSKRMDYYMKLFKYRVSGVREYWIVDPDKNRIMVYNFDHEI